MPTIRARQRQPSAARLRSSGSAGRRRRTRAPIFTTAILCSVAARAKSPRRFCRCRRFHLKGVHNVENVLAAVCATRLAGASPAAIRLAVAGFHAVEHRLEFVANMNGVDYYNDSKATNVDATIKAIESFPGNIHLILGGKDKNSDYSQLNSLLRTRVKAVYTIGAAAEKIETQIRGAVQFMWCRRTLCSRQWRTRRVRRCRATWCCWLRPAPASTSSKITNIADVSSKTSCWKGAASGYGKTRRRRQMALRRNAAARRHRAGDGLQRLGRHGQGALRLALHLRDEAGAVGGAGPGRDDRPDAARLSQVESPEGRISRWLRS